MSKEFQNYIIKHENFHAKSNINLQLIEHKIEDKISFLTNKIAILEETIKHQDIKIERLHQP